MASVRVLSTHATEIAAKREASRLWDAGRRVTWMRTRDYREQIRTADPWLVIEERPSIEQKPLA